MYLSFSLLNSLRISISRFANRHLFTPEGRRFELFSTTVLLGWIAEFVFHAETFLRPTYQGFHGVPTQLWLAIFSSAVVLQLFTFFWRPKYWDDLRFLSMSVHASLWGLVTVSFVIGGVSSTATVNYAALTVFCAMNAWRIAWKRSF